MQMLSVITVTYNSAAVLARLLAGIPAGTEIIVVDNGSLDQSQAIARAAGAKVIQGGNVGYGRGANAGLREVKTKYALLVNPDVEITPEAIAKMVACMEAHPNIGILGANVDGVAGEGLTEVNWIVGALMLFRMEALKQVGMFDENIFLFYEETDICRRFLKAGWKLANLGSAQASHEAGTSSAQSMKLLKIKAWHAAWSKCYYYRKHYSWFTYARKTATKLIYAICRGIRGCYSFRREQIIKNLYELFGVLAYIGGMKAFRGDVGRLT